MLFNSYEFIFVFLPLSIALHFCMARQSISAAIVATTLSSLAFYAWWKPPFIVLPILSILTNFWIAKRILGSAESKARGILIAGIVANLLVLFYYKYADFILSIIEARNTSAPDVPLALSFTTFVQIAFLVDVGRRRGQIAFANYALFVSFFPHLIAGPIVRWNELGPQIVEKLRYRLDWNNVALGLTIFCLGLGKKVLIADRLALHVGPVFDAAARGEAITAFAAWGGAFAYSAQLYFDFSGYSDMAVGLGLLFNLRLPINFAAPLRATSIIDLWRRWHITLSRFLREFVYLPLGGNKGSPVRRSLNLIATMVLGGLWHGANWTFIAWGAFHGALLAINHAWRSRRGPRPETRISSLAGWFATFVAFAIGMVFFRAADISAATMMLKAMVGFGEESVPDMIAVTWDRWGIEKGYLPESFARIWIGAHWSFIGTFWTIGALAIALLAPDTMELADYREGETHSDWRRDIGFLAWHPSVAWCVTILATFVVLVLNLMQFTEFLYYQF